MTCIVAVEAERSVWIGADSFMGDHESDVTDRAKVFTVSGVTFAACGSFRCAQVLEFCTKFRRMKRGEDAQRYLVQVVSKAVRNAFTEAGLIKDQTHDAAFIAAIGGRAYEFQDDFSFIRSARGFTALGAGQKYALGALSALHALPAKERALASLAAAADTCTLVRGPFHVQEVK